LKEFIEQVEKFQSTSHHRILITGRPLAMQGIEKSAFRNKCLDRVKLLPMNNQIRNNWLRKWASKFGEVELKEFVDFLKACPADIENKLAREPLLLYMLGRIHYEKAITAANLSGTSGMAAKVKIYDTTIEWVLAKQRKDLNQKVFNFELEIDELRQLLTEVAVCVIQAGNEIAKVNAIEYRLTKDPNNKLKELFDKIRGTAINEEKALNNLLTTFYIQPAQGDRDGAVEFAHKSFGEFLFAERIKEAICDWSRKITIKNKQEDQINKKELEWQIYDLLGSVCLTPDIVDYLREMLATSNDWQPLRLFERLNQFWEEWCEGEFIDRTEDNLPQKKMKVLKEQMPERETQLGIRQVDVYTGLNVLILLLELHRYAQGSDELKDSIVFYPSGKSPAGGYTTRLLKVIHYSDSIEFDNFNQNLLLFLISANLISANLIDANLSGANLSGANLSDANLSGANLSRANLSGADLSRANLGDANLIGADLIGANLGDANLGDANLSRATLSDANLSRANLSDANLSRANLLGADLIDAGLSLANLRDADLRDADLSDANLFGANLSDANLIGANLRTADLSDADLSGANLSGADLSGANLSGADLSGADLIGVKWDKLTSGQYVRGLGSAIDLPEELKQQLGLD
jgi:uncharacterized protein YjbI with pentapeptide repeats